MPIEFRCTHCSRLLRTHDDAVGRKAKCPECGTILEVPAPGASSEAVAPEPGAGAPGPPAPFEPPPGAGESPFGPEIRPGAKNPYASPRDYTVGAPAVPAAAGAIAPTRIDVGDVLGRSWEIYKRQFGMCFGLVIVAGLINFGVSSVAGMIPFVGGIASALFSVWLYIGVALGLLAIARGRQTSFDVMFQGGPYFLNILVASMLYGLMTLGLFAILLVPAMGVAVFAMQGVDPPIIIVVCIVLALLAAIPPAIVALMYSQFYYLIVDRNAGVFESFSLSKQVTTGNKLTLFGIWALMGLLNLAGLLACCMGILFTAPLTALMNVVVYLAMTGQPTAGQHYYPSTNAHYGGGAGSSPFGSAPAPGR